MIHWGSTCCNEMEQFKKQLAEMIRYKNEAEHSLYLEQKKNEALQQKIKELTKPKRKAGRPFGAKDSKPRKSLIKVNRDFSFWSSKEVQ